jgi:hypothetical protein
MSDLVMVRGMAVVRQALLAWCDDLVPAGGVVWGLGNSPGQKHAIPSIVFQPDPRGQATRYIGMPTGWIGAVTMRVRAATLDEAALLAKQAADLIPASSEPTDQEYAPGWSLTLQKIAPLVGLPGPTVATAGIIYRATIRPKAAV